MTAHPTLPGRIWRDGEELTDTAERWEVPDSGQEYDGGFVAVRRDTVRSPEGDEFDRLVVETQGAVGVLALDEDDRVLLLRQYRHAVGRRLLEIPAGILDVDGESPLAAAGRELTEESDVVADQWSELVEIWPSPGRMDEHWRIYLARGLRPAAAGSVPERRHEEAHLEVVWVPLAETVRAVIDGRITDSMAMVALLAVWAQRHPPA